MKDTYLKWKKTSNWINNRLDTTEEKKISEFEHLTIDTNKNEEYRKKKNERINRISVSCGKISCGPTHT